MATRNDFPPPEVNTQAFPPPQAGTQVAAAHGNGASRTSPPTPPAADVITPVAPAAPANPTQPADPAHTAGSPAHGLDPTQAVEAVLEAAQPHTLHTQSGKSDGLNKCPKCGSSEISTQEGTGLLVCAFCRYVFEPPKPLAVKDPKDLRGEIIGSGAQNITEDASQVTIKCQGCGAEVVVNIEETAWARCHWCRQVLTLENQMPNGAVPDMLLPFLLSKADAQQRIAEFTKKRAFFANTNFKREFTTANIIGVYLPYLVVDANIHCDMRGKAGNVVRKYQVGTGDNRRTVYDIDVYDIGRDYDLAIDNLTVEASSDKLNVNNAANTNNIINTILPFDVENAIAYDGNYLKGFNSERRDANIDAVRGLVGAQINDVSRYAAKTTASNYAGGIKWESEDVQVKGTQWLSAYLPVWLYSYMQVKGGGQKLLHYIAVNARTGETMGSVPVSQGRILAVSFAIEIVAFVIVALIFMAFFLSS